jgi:hypothetical protein
MCSNQAELSRLQFCERHCGRNSTRRPEEDDGAAIASGSERVTDGIGITCRVDYDGCIKIRQPPIEQPEVCPDQRGRVFMATAPCDDGQRTSAGQPGEPDRKGTNGAGAEHAHSIAELQLGPADPVPTDHREVDQRCLLDLDARRDSDGP